MAAEVVVAEMLLRLLPLVPELVDGICGALERGEDTEARRLLQEATTRQALLEEAIHESKDAPSQKRAPARKSPARKAKR